MDFDFLTEYLLEDTSSGAPASFDINSSSTSPEHIIENDVNSHHIRKMQILSAQSDLKQQNIEAKEQTVLPSGSVPVDTKTVSPKRNDSLSQQGFDTHSDYIASESAKRQRMENSSTSVHIKEPIVASPAQAPPDAIAGRGRKKTQAQIDRRRERNRILARRTRLRKKFFFESLQKEVVDLQRENTALKAIVRSKLSEDGTKILEECSAAERLPDAVVEACGEHTSDIGKQDFNLVRSIQQSQHSFVITDPSLQDNPIVFASDDFLNLTGYSREEVLGRNCRFLQGVDTCPTKVQAIRKGIATGSDVSVTLLNYTANGSPFWNKLFIAALRDAQDNVVNFIGVLVKVASSEVDDAGHGKSLPDDDLAT